MLCHLILAAVVAQGAWAAENKCGPECYPSKWDYESNFNMDSWLTGEEGSEESEEARVFWGNDKKNEDSAPPKLKFILHTRSNPIDGQELDLNDENTFKNFRPLQPTKMIVHGWMSKYWSDFNNNSRNGYLAKGDFNVIHVDWYKTAKKFYPNARSHVSGIGGRVGDFILALQNKNLITLKDLHLIGHSLGAHIAGIAGLRVKEVSGQLVDRITGLDPAAPMFSKENTKRLRKSAASFVDVIHTCGITLGYFSPLGHVDFYPNAGHAIQPGCGMDVLGKCSHKRAHLFFTESILDPAKFLGIACDDYNLWAISKCKQEFAFMGDNVARNSSGVFYLKTADKLPFGLGLKSIFL